MNIQEVRDELTKIEAELKKLAEEANAKFHVMQGMKNAYNKVLSVLEHKSVEVKQDIAEDLNKEATKLETPKPQQE